MIAKELGSKIKDAGVKQCELSKRAGLSASVVSEILSGRRVPTKEQLDKILNGMGEICAVLHVANEMMYQVEKAKRSL